MKTEQGLMVERVIKSVRDLKLEKKTTLNYQYLNIRIMTL